MSNPVKAIGMLSGGLDSILAVKIMLDMGVEVIAYNHVIPFHSSKGDRSQGAAEVAKRFGIELVVEEASQEFIEMVKHPRFGTGKGHNPCIDCRIYIMKRAALVMQEKGADFIFTGEVVGSRPMSQRLKAMQIIEEKSGLKGKLLRPLSARFFEPTEVELAGLIDRDKMPVIQGRSRKIQMELAEKHDIGPYPNPGGGCALTEPLFAVKLLDAFEYGEDDISDMDILRLGRHFRLPGGAKVISGRDEGENRALQSYFREGDLLLEVADFGGPLVLLRKAEEGDIERAAQIAITYSDAKDSMKPVRVTVSKSDGSADEIFVSPIPREETILWNLGIQEK